MKILVLGGTGAIGVHLVHLLSTAGCSITVTSRVDRISNHADVKYIKGNAKDIYFLKTLMDFRWDVIVDFMSYKTVEFESNLNTILPFTGQYIFLSSSRVFAESHVPINESALKIIDVIHDEEYLKTDEYALAKARQERVLLNSEYKNWTIVRPYITYDINRLQLGVLEKEEWLYRILNGRTSVLPRDILAYTTTLSHGIDVSSAIFSLIGRKDALCEDFNIASSYSLSWSEVLNIYKTVLENKKRITPRFKLVDIDDFLRFRSGVTKYQVIFDRLYNRTFDNSKIVQFMGVENFAKPEIALLGCISEFLDNPVWGSIDWRQQAIMDRIVNERSSFSNISGIKNKLKYIYFRYLSF